MSAPACATVIPPITEKSVGLCPNRDGGGCFRCSSVRRQKAASFSQGTACVSGTEGEDLTHGCLKSNSNPIYVLDT